MDDTSSKSVKIFTWMIFFIGVLFTLLTSIFMSFVPILTIAWFRTHSPAVSFICIVEFIIMGTVLYASVPVYLFRFVTNRSDALRLAEYASFYEDMLEVNREYIKGIVHMMTREYHIIFRQISSRLNYTIPNRAALKMGGISFLVFHIIINLFGGLFFWLTVGIWFIVMSFPVLSCMLGGIIGGILTCLLGAGVIGISKMVT